MLHCFLVSIRSAVGLGHAIRHVHHHIGHVARHVHHLARHHHQAFKLVCYTVGGGAIGGVPFLAPPFFASPPPAVAGFPGSGGGFGAGIGGISFGAGGGVEETPFGTFTTPGLISPSLITPAAPTETPKIAPEMFTPALTPVTSPEIVPIIAPGIAPEKIPTNVPEPISLLVFLPALGLLWLVGGPARQRS